MLLHHPCRDTPPKTVRAVATQPSVGNTGVLVSLQSALTRFEGHNFFCARYKSMKSRSTTRRSRKPRNNRRRASKIKRSRRGGGLKSWLSKKFGKSTADKEREERDLDSRIAQGHRIALAKYKWLRTHPDGHRIRPAYRR